MRRFLTIALALVMMLTVCAFALELDTAETSVNEEAALFSAVTDPASEVHPTYGKLVFYQDFEGTDKTATYVDPTILANSAGSWTYAFANCNGSLVADPVNPDSGNTVCLVAGNGTSGYARIYIKPKLTGCYGVYTAVMDYYYTSNSTTRNIDNMMYIPAGSSSGQLTGRFASYQNKGAWNYNDKGSVQIRLVAEGEENISSKIGYQFTE